MGEYIPTHDGIPLKSLDAALDYISAQKAKIKSLEEQLAMYRTIVPTGADQPAHV